MLIGWDTWIVLAIAGLGAAASMISGVIRYQSKFGRPWVAIFSSGIAVIVCLGLMAGTLYAAYLLDDSARLFKNPPSPNHLEVDWGQKFSNAEKFKISSTIARSNFVNWGIHTNYFDLNGNFTQYQPTAEDREYRLGRLSYIERTESSRTLLLWSAVGFAIIPWLALSLGLIIFRSRSKTSPYGTQ